MVPQSFKNTCGMQEILSFEYEKNDFMLTVVNEYSVIYFE